MHRSFTFCLFSSLFQFSSYFFYHRNHQSQPNARQYRRYLLFTLDTLNKKNWKFRNYLEEGARASCDNFSRYVCEDVKSWSVARSAFTSSQWMLYLIQLQIKSKWYTQIQCWYCSTAHHRQYIKNSNSMPMLISDFWEGIKIPDYWNIPNP